MGGELLWCKSKSKSKSMAESLLFKALLRCALRKEGISLKADDDVVYPPSKSFYDKKQVVHEDIPEYIKKEMKERNDAFAAAYADAVASKKDKFYELCGVSEAELRFDYANEIKKMERELYGDLNALALSGKKTDTIKKVEEFEKKRFFKIYGHPGPEKILPNICGIQRKGNTNNNNSMIRIRSSSSRILLFGS